MTTYEHRQIGYVHIVLWFVAALAFIVAANAPDDEGRMVAIIAGGVLFVLSMCFVWLTVRDEGDQLVVEFGPVALFRRRVHYAEIDSAQVGRSSLIDGWGIHLVPGRGWTWNIWGRDCVELTMGRRRLRIGSNDPDGLAAFLQERIAQAQPTGGSGRHDSR